MAEPSEKDVRTWVDASRYDLETARALLKSRRFLYVLFMCQQAIEKILKACATAKTGEFPPRIHNLTRLGELAALEFTEEEKQLLERLSLYYLQSRYPPEIHALVKNVTGSMAATQANGGPMAKAKKAVNADEMIRRAIEYLLQKIRVDQAVLFGSHARGAADEWSDVDLAVISPDFARMSHKRIMDLLVEVALTVDASVEIRPYTPSDFKEARPTNFLGHILAEGKVVYKDGDFVL